MYICNHFILDFPLKKYILPLLSDNGIFAKILPRQSLIPSNNSGIAYTILLNSLNGNLNIYAKILIGLHNNASFTAQFVLKTTITLPIEILASEMLDEISLNNSLHIEDKISCLIIDNPLEAKELFEKF